MTRASISSGTREGRSSSRNGSVMDNFLRVRPFAQSHTRILPFNPHDNVVNCSYAPICQT